MSQLVPTFSDFLVRLKEAVHGADGAEVIPFVQEGRIDLLRGFIHEPVGMKKVENFLAFLGRSGAFRARSLLRLQGSRRLPCLHAKNPARGTSSASQTGAIPISIERVVAASISRSLLPRRSAAALSPGSEIFFLNVNDDLGLSEAPG